MVGWSNNRAALNTVIPALSPGLNEGRGRRRRQTPRARDTRRVWRREVEGEREVKREDGGGGTEAKDGGMRGDQDGRSWFVCRRVRAGIPGGRDRRDDNICIIFNARTSGLRGGRQPPHPAAASFFLVVVVVSFASSLPLSWSPSAASRSLRVSLCRSRDRAPPPATSNATSPLPPRARSRLLATPSNIPLKSIPPHCLLYLPGLIIRTQIYCVSLAAREHIPPSSENISRGQIARDFV